jgi:intracellular sulfur oxidation DsrE/DsrF family protein
MVVAMALSPAGVVLAGESAPWGKAQLVQIEYSPQKVVYDISVHDDEDEQGHESKKNREVKNNNKDEKVQEIKNVDAVEDGLENVLDRVSYLNNIYHGNPFEAAIVVVLHGDEIPMFAIENYGKYKDLMVRAQSLTVGGTIEFRMCTVAARNHGLEPEDIHGFVKVVPMADAEIIRLQRDEGYAYMQ